MAAEKEQFLRLRAVMQRTGLSCASLYAMVARGEFPAQIRITEHGRAVAWLSSDVDRWMHERIRRHRTPTGPQASRSGEIA
jgi:prophage regulatory protein